MRSRRLDGGLGVAVRGQTLHVEVGGRQRLPGLVLDGWRVWEPLGQRRLLAERLRQRRVGQRPARVEPLPERVHHADLRTNNNRLEWGDGDSGAAMLWFLCVWKLRFSSLGWSGIYTIKVANREKVWLG